MKIKQINNIEIHLTLPSRFSCGHREFWQTPPVYSRQSKTYLRILEEFDSLGAAENWCRSVKDFLRE